MRQFLNLAVFLLLAIAASGQDQTLADFLQEHKIPLPSDPHIHVNDRPAKTLIPLETDEEFALAYRLAHPDGGLYGPIQFIRYDKHMDRWTSVTVDQPKFRFQGEMEVPCTGMVGGLKYEHSHYFISVELSPSAGCEIILKNGGNNMSVEAVLDGWMAGFLSPATVLYSGNMIHFADVHPATLWTYDLGSKKATQIYPQPNDPFRRDFATKLEKIIDQNLCRENNWACEPDRFTTDVDSPITTNQQTKSIAFGARFEPEGFMDRYKAEDSGLFDDDAYVYIFQLQPFRWREFSIYDLKPKFGTSSLQQLISPKMIEKVFATPAPD